MLRIGKKLVARTLLSRRARTQRALAPVRTIEPWQASELEPRLLLAGDAGAAVLDAAQSGDDAGIAAEVGAAVPGQMVGDEAACATTARHLLIVDAAVSDFSVLTDSVAADTDVVLLAPHGDAIAQISEILSDRRGLQSLQILSHGEAGALQLSGQRVDTARIDSRADEIALWRQSLAEGADLLLYGCDTAAGTAGAQFVGRLADLTGADVAASVDRTGHLSEGANWALEYTVGSIETELAFAHAALEAYVATLPIVIYAAGETGQEQMELRINNVTVQTWNNIGGNYNAGQFQAFTYNNTQPVSPDQIQVAFTNDSNQGGQDRNLRVDRIEIDGVAFQTEAPSVYSTGTWLPEDGIVPGFRQSEFLHSNGHFQFAQPNTNTGSLLQIRAAGETGDETMELRIDGQVVQTWNNIGGDASSRQFQTFLYRAAETISADRVQVAFTNDLFQDGVVDRNLYVDNIAIDGVVYETEAPTTFSNGTWVPDQGLIPGYHETEILHSSGHFQFAGTPPNEGQTQIVIHAAGETNYETMELRLDGETVRTWEMVGGNASAQQYATYSHFIDGEVAARRISVAFVNDYNDGEIDYNLRVDRITVNGVNYQTESPSVYSTGTWLAEDGIVPGFRQNEYLHGNGYFQYEANASPGSIQLATSTIEVNENASMAVVRILRSAGTNTTTTVDYATLAGTATAGQDYTSRSGTLTFLPGETFKDVTIPIIDDTLAEGNESFNFAIDNVTGGAVLLAPRTATITIKDNDLTVPNYSQFANSNGLTLGGSARVTGNQLQLTSTTTNQAGSAYYQTALPVNTDTSFQTQFQFRLDGAQGAAGADGFAFVLQNDPRGLQARGAAGGGLGLSGITNSLAIEFDTWQNENDVNNNHIAVVINGDIANPRSVRIPAFDLNSGSTINAWVDYNGNTDQLAVYLNNGTTKPDQPLMMLEIDLTSVVGSQAYLGFTGATGGSANVHRVLNWSFSLDTPSNIQPPTPGTTLVAETLYRGLVQPTDIDWSQDGRNLYISQQDGLVRIARDGQLLTTPFIDIRNQVNGTRDRGLLDIAVHPDFENNPYVYMLFTYDPPEVYNNASHTLAGPDRNGNRAGRLIRVTADAATNYTTAVAGSEVVLLGSNSTWQNFNAFANSTTDFNEPPAGILPNGTNLRDFIASDSESHTIGSLAFGNDGALYVAIGDGTSYNRVDPRSVRVQDIDNLSGKVLRIDPLTGDGLADNPFFNGDAGANRSKVYQLGLRNPFRIAVDSETGQLYIGDVGWTRWEEINSAGPGANFGWPYYEGGSGNSVRTPGYDALPEAIAFYNSGQSVTASQYALNHASDGINAIVLGAVYRGDAYPAEFQGDLFFNDLGQGIVRNANLDANGNVVSVQNFTTGAQIVVSIQQGPDGTLHYVDLNDGQIGRWYFA